MAKKKYRIKHCYNKEANKISYAYVAGVKKGTVIYYCDYCDTLFDYPVHVGKADS